MDEDKTLVPSTFNLQDSDADPALKRAVETLNLLTQEFVKKPIREHIERPYKRETPKEKIKKRPDGFDYVKGSYMDKIFKEFFPLYEYVGMPIVEDIPAYGVVRVTCVLKEKIFGNTEFGVGAARIQVSKSTKSAWMKGERHNITPFDLIDYDKNVKSAAENARKNAQRQFGICSDVYGRREFSPNDEEKERFESLARELPPDKQLLFRESWEALGDGFTDFLDYYERKIEAKYRKKDTPKNTTEEKPQSQNTQTESTVVDL